MSATNEAVEALYEQASGLTPSDRAQLAGLLLESIEDEPEEGVEEAWAAEIERRIADYRAGRLRMIPWSEARAYLHRSDR
jgi:putative addiction module component (TIGR02574 family)